MKPFVKRFFLYISVTAILFQLLTTSCAKEMMPQGGPKDTIPPRVLKSYPLPFQTNFKDKKIVIKFNEFFDLKDFDKQFFVSPPFATKPIVAIRGKKLIIRLKDSLRDSVTYTFDFGNSIVDFTEGNPLENFKLVFSTYDKIDTLRASGQVIDAFTGQPIQGAYVMLYKKNAPDSAVYLHTPRYVTVTDKKGNFQILGIKKGCYKIVAIEDLNADFIYDGIEKNIAFLDTPICVSAKLINKKITLKKGTVLHDSATGKIIDTLSKDSVIIQHIVKYTPDNIVLRMFEEQARPQQIVGIKRVYPFECMIRFNYPLYDNYYRIRPLQGKNQDYIFSYDNKSDSLFIWVKNKKISNLDTLAFIANYYAPQVNGKVMRQDTLIFEQPESKNEKLIIKPQSSEITAFDSLVLKTNIYLTKFYPSHMQLLMLEDTSLMQPRDVRLRIVRVEPGLINIYFSLPLMTKYKLWINQQQITGKYDQEQKRLTINLPDNLKDMDTLYFKFYYWLKRFNNFNEFHSLSKKIVLSRQELISSNRITWDSLVLAFTKPVRQFQVIPNNNIIWKRVNPFVIGIKLKKPADKVQFKIKTLDFAHLGTNPIFYEKNIQSIYQYKPNKIKTIARVDRGRVVLIFERKPAGVFMINTPDPKLQGNLNKHYTNGDTLTIDFQSKEFKRMKVNKIVVGFYDYNRQQKVKLYDTINAELDKNPLLKNTTIYLPQKFVFSRVKNTPLTFMLAADLQPDNKYRFLAMPGSFVNVLGIKNDSIYTIDFKTTDVKSYGSLKLTFKNVPSYVWHGQLIIQLLDKDNKVVYQYFTSKPSLTIAKVIPGDYTLKIILDTNKNGRWDTGNYLRHEQPEKIYILPQKLSAKPNWQIEETISLKSLDKK